LPGVFLAPLESGEKDRHLVGKRRQASGVEVLLVQALGRGVSALFIEREGLVDGALSREAGVDRLAQELRVSKRVGDPEGQDGILVATGIADERPAGPEWLPIEVGTSAVP
jgi:hypothetical protein